MSSQPPGASSSPFASFPDDEAASTTEDGTDTPGTGVWLASAVTALGFLALTVLDAKATAMLAGSVSFFGFKEVVLDAVLTIGFGWVFVCARSNSRPVLLPAAVLCGVALWRGVDFVFNVLTAAIGTRLEYWDLTQYLNGVLLLVCAVGAALVVRGLRKLV